MDMPAKDTSMPCLITNVSTEQQSASDAIRNAGFAYAFRHRLPISVTNKQDASSVLQSVAPTHSNPDGAGTRRWSSRVTVATPA
jgi:hypothetical protein